MSTTVALPDPNRIEVTGVPTDVAQAIRDVYVTTGGQALASGVLDAARDTSSPLHGYFEWDDTAAAEAHRRSQAEALVRRVKVVIIPAKNSPPVRVRAYVARRELPAEGQPAAPPGTYLAIEDVAGESGRQAALLESIEKDVARLQRKYANVKDFGAILRSLLEDSE